MASGSRQSTTRVSQPVDLKTPTERARNERAAALQLGMLEEPDLGYEDTSGQYQQLRQQEEDRFKQGVIGTTSDLGFSPRMSGVSTSVIGRGLGDIAARESARRGQEYTDWRKWMLSGSRAGPSAAGYGQTTTSTSRSRGGSPWARAAGGLVGGVIGRTL